MQTLIFNNLAGPLPVKIYVVFGLAVIIGLFGIFKSTNYKRSVILTILVWVILQSVISLTGFYTQFKVLPPRLPLLVIPPFILVMSTVLSKRGKALLDGVDIKTLTLLQVIRFPIEITLYWLFLYHKVPQLITFEGRNFDILSGLTAPVVFYFGFVKKTLSYKILIGWNIICLLLLTNVVINALLSSPTRFQLFAFKQPNIAIGYFPFILLPSFLVPAVAFASIASLYQLIKKKQIN